MAPRRRPDVDIVQVRTLRTPDALAARLADLGLGLAVDAEVDPHGSLGQPLGVAGREAANRFCVLPMEGWDGETDGSPSDLVRRRWQRFGAGGAFARRATGDRPDSPATA